MRAVALHPDVLVVTSALLHANCVIVRGAVSAGTGGAEEAAGGRPEDEVFVIDSPVLPEELDSLGALIEQAGFPRPSGLLATHADWDHLLARLAFADLTLGVAESTAARLRAEPGVAQRELRAFDEELLIERRRPLALGSLQGLPVPGRCDLGDREIELHPADGHTPDGMFIWIPWARILLAGDYCSTVEIPQLRSGQGADAIAAYLATLERMRALIAQAEYIVPGHGPTLGCGRALEVLAQDTAYLCALREQGAAAELPKSRLGAASRRRHLANVASTEKHF